MKAGGGLITKEDLAAIEPSADPSRNLSWLRRLWPPPPSSGGICLVEMLNILETFDLAKHDRWSPETMHLMIEPCAGPISTGSLSRGWRFCRHPAK